MPVMKYGKDFRQSRLVSKQTSDEGLDYATGIPTKFEMWAQMSKEGVAYLLGTTDEKPAVGYNTSTIYARSQQSQSFTWEQKQVRPGIPSGAYEMDLVQPGLHWMGNVVHRHTPGEVETQAESDLYFQHYLNVKEAWEPNVNVATPSTVREQLTEMMRLLKTFGIEQAPFADPEGAGRKARHKLIPHTLIAKLWPENIPLFGDEQKATFEALTDPRERYASSLENDERLRLLDELHLAFEQEPFEDGIAHAAEQIMADAISEFDSLDWFSGLCADVSQPTLAASILRCLGRQSLPGTDIWRRNLIRTTLAVDDAEIRYAAVKVVEIWGESDPSLVQELRLHDEPERWIRRYIQDVIDGLGG